MLLFLSHFSFAATAAADVCFPLSLSLHEKRGKSLATLRERVERQRSVTSAANHDSESNSLEGLNLERGDTANKARCVEQLDNQVSSLHQDVATLSMEVGVITVKKKRNCENITIHHIQIDHLFAKR